MMTVKRIKRNIFTNFALKRGDIILQTERDYFIWLKEMMHLRTPWLRGGEKIGIYGLKTEDKLCGVLRILKIPFYERKEWGYDDEYRGEIQDIYVVDPERHLEEFLKKSVEIINRRGLKAYGISEWKEENLKIIEGLGHYPFA